MMKFALEFILHARGSSPASIKSALAEFGSNLTVAECQKHAESCNYQVEMVTEDPTLVFDLCSQLGRIRSVKVHESAK
ncbi:MAG: hypothetical protein PHS66_07710 [Candidatus Omnitrophica bacterium]|nr:hypothetical protein [Candidatus Omnitrophota bacterium]